MWVNLGVMSASNNVFVDTAPFIYLVEGHPEFSQPIVNYFADQLSIFESQFFTSTITLAEFLVKPKQRNDQGVITKFKDKLNEYDVLIADISIDVAELSADLRVKYPKIKMADAIQLSAAIRFGCTKFLTNDQGLNAVTELQILSVRDLPK